MYFRDRHERIRSRLQDLSLRNNPLLNFNFYESGTRSVPIVDELPDQVFKCLVERRTPMTLLPFPVPEGDEQAEPMTAVQGAEDALAERRRIESDEPEELPDDREDAFEDRRTYHDRNLQTHVAADKFPGKLLRVHSEYNSLIQSTGSNFLYLAFGYLEWFDAEAPTKPRRAPLVLVPVALEKKLALTDLGGAKKRAHEYAVRWTGEEVVSNLSLAMKLRREPYGLELTPFDRDEHRTPDAYFDLIRTFVSAYQPRHSKPWRLRRRMALGFFKYRGDVMFRDLDLDRWGAGAFESHPLIRAAYGMEAGAPAKPRGRGARIPLPADSSQEKIVRRVLDGESLVVQGPPGTGKSQTIANMIGAAMGAGLRVLFVAEKLTALDVVYENFLRGAGLTPYCLRVHSDKASPASVFEQVATRLRLPPAIQNRDDSRSADAQGKLDDYCARLGRVISGDSMFNHYWKLRTLRDRMGGDPELLKLLPRLQVDEKEWTAEVHGRLRERAELAARLISGGILKHASAWMDLDATAERAVDLVALELALHDLLGAADGVRSALAGSADGPPLAGSTLKAVETWIGFLRDHPPPEDVDESLARELGLENCRTAVAAWLKDAERFERPFVGVEERFFTALLGREDFPAVDLAELLAACAAGGAFGRTPLDTRAQSASAAELLAVLAKAMNLCAAISGRFALSKPIDTFEGAAEWAGRLGGLLDLDPRIVDALDTCYADPQAELQIRQARRTAGELAERRAKLDALYNTKLALDDPDMYLTLARSLNAQAGSLTRFWPFGADARMRGLARTFARPGVNVLSREFIDHLDDLRAFEGDCRAFKWNGAMIDRFGNLFEGIDTDFGRLETCARTVRDLAAWVGADNLSAGIEAVRALHREDATWRAVMGEIEELAGQVDALGHRAGAERPDGVPFDRLEAELRRYKTARDETLALLDSTKADPSADYGVLEAGLKAARDAHARYRRVCRFLDDSPFIGRTEGLTLGEKIGRIRRTFEWGVQACEAGVGCEDAALDTLRRFPGGHASALARGLQVRKKMDRFRAGFGALERLGQARSDSRFDPMRASVPIDVWIRELDEAKASAHHLPDWADYCRARKHLRESLTPLVNHVESGADPLALTLTIDYLHHERWLDGALRREPGLRNFRRDEHEAQRRAYREETTADLTRNRCAIVSALRERGGRAPSGIRNGNVGEKTELGLLQHVAATPRARVTVRSLIERSAAALGHLLPCWMMDPASVAKFLPQSGDLFDLVIIDEASQVRTVEALGALARARQAVVVGDTKQMPPTDFFRSGAFADDDAEPGDDAEDRASILDAVSGTLPFDMLRWHYRSRHESLIRFSNDVFYDRRLVVPPSSVRHTEEHGITWHYLEAKYREGENLIEAVAVTRALVRHVLENSRKSTGDQQSVGVVVMNGRQQELVESLFAEEERKNDALAEALPAFNPAEATFIRNLESVQGDERDVIIIGFTYGPDPETGKVHRRFGPLNRPGGERRLNVLVTRARHRIHAFTSMRSDDLRQVSATEAVGVATLRRYLEYAEGGWAAATPANTDPTHDRLAVARAISGLGYTVVGSIGDAPCCVDLAVADPKRPDRFMAGLLLDGPNYHGTQAALDREVMGERMLERHGWKLHRLWTPEWHRHSSAEMDRLKVFLESVAHAGNHQGRRARSQER